MLSVADAVLNEQVTRLYEACSDEVHEGTRARGASSGPRFIGAA